MIGESIAELWRAFVYGFSNTLGIAYARRHVETPEESFDAVRNELRAAISEAKKQT